VPEHEIDKLMNQLEKRIEFTKAAV
jgi:hypothetical protein